MRLWEALTSRTGRGSLRVWDGTAFVQTPWRDVAAEAAGIAATLRRLGVRPGRNVAALLTNTPATVPGLLGVWLAGGTIASLPIPTPGMDIEEYSRRIGALVAKLDAPLTLTDEWLQPLLPASPPSRSWESLRDAGVPFDARWGSLQVAGDRGAPPIALGGGTGDAAGNANALASRWPKQNKGKYRPVTYGSSHIQAIAFLSGGRVSAHTILTYSQYEDPTSRFSSDQTRMFGHKKWVSFAFTPKQIRRQQISVAHVTN